MMPLVRPGEYRGLPVLYCTVLYCVQVSIAGSQDLQDQFQLTRGQAAFGLTAFSITGTLIADKCPQGGPRDA